jgi:hypothetical protein
MAWRDGVGLGGLLACAALHVKGQGIFMLQGDSLAGAVPRLLRPHRADLLRMLCLLPQHPHHPAGPLQQGMCRQQQRGPLQPRPARLRPAPADALRGVQAAASALLLTPALAQAAGGSSCELDGLELVGAAYGTLSWGVQRGTMSEALLDGAAEKSACPGPLCPSPARLSVVCRGAAFPAVLAMFLHLLVGFRAGAPRSKCMLVAMNMPTVRLRAGLLRRGPAQNISVH